MVHYPELADSKGIVLMVAEYDSTALVSAQDGLEPPAAAEGGNLRPVDIMNGGHELWGVRTAVPTQFPYNAVDLHLLLKLFAKWPLSPRRPKTHTIIIIILLKLKVGEPLTLISRAYFTH